MDGICVFLNGDRGIPVVQRLRDAGHAFCGIFVPPGKGRALAAALATDAVTEVGNVNDPGFCARLAALGPRLGLVAGFSSIFRQTLIDIPALGTINLHGGRLPEYRGGSPLNWQIIRGEPRVGISVIRLDQGIDTGEVLADAEIPLGPADTIAEVHERANGIFPRLVLDVVERFARGNTAGVTQDSVRAAYWHQRSDADGHVDWRGLSSQEVHNLVRAVTRPYPGAFAFVGEALVRIYRTEVPATAIRGVPGRVCYIQGVGPYVVCRDQAILVRDYQFEGESNARLRHGDHLA